MRAATGRIAVLFVAFAIQTTICPPVGGQDFSSCSWELNRLVRLAREAEWAAVEAESAEQEFESAKSQLENCLLYPAIYDLFGDECEYHRWVYENSRGEFTDAVSNLVAALDDINVRLRRIQYECGYQFSLKYSTTYPNTATADYSNAMCSIVQRFKGVYADSVLLDVCRVHLPEDSCRKCLGL